MPHAGHFICAYQCHFKLNTYVGGYIVSTVGEMANTNEFHKKLKTNDWEEIGVGRKYETMVFKAKKSKDKCCSYEAIIAGGEIDIKGYNKSEDAYKGHLKMCNKYAKKP